MNKYTKNVLLPQLFKRFLVLNSRCYIFSFLYRNLLIMSKPDNFNVFFIV